MPQSKKPWSAAKKARQAENYAQSAKRREARAAAQREAAFVNDERVGNGELTPWQTAQVKRAALRELRSHVPHVEQHKSSKPKSLTLQIEQLKNDGFKPEWAKPGWRHPDRAQKDNNTNQKGKAA